MDLTRENLLCMFTYDNGRLWWKPRSGIAAGTEAGSIASNGYKRVNLHGKTHAVARIIFVMHNGYNPEFVDHINGDKLDNRIENLRPATRVQNNSNRKRKTKLPKGVSRNKSGSYHVRITVGGKTKSIGSYADIELAELVATEARNKYHKEFANHG